MLTSTNRIKVSLIKVSNNYFYISLVDVKNEENHILHSRAFRASRVPGILLIPISFQTPDTQAIDSVVLITPLTIWLKSSLWFSPG